MTGNWVFGHWESGSAPPTSEERPRRSRKAERSSFEEKIDWRAYAGSSNPACLPMDDGGRFCRSVQPIAEHSFLL
jgi:hypothetical protein